MILGNKLYKQAEADIYREIDGEQVKVANKGDLVRITTDDIPEGEINLYSLNYPDGKRIGDIIIRFNPDDIDGHALLDGRKIYRYEAPEFYQYCDENCEIAQSEYNEGYRPHYNFYPSQDPAGSYENYLESHTNTQVLISDSAVAFAEFCPYFVLDVETGFVVHEVLPYKLEQEITFDNLPELDSSIYNHAYTITDAITTDDRFVDLEPTEYPAGSTFLVVNTDSLGGDLVYKFKKIDVVLKYAKVPDAQSAIGKLKSGFVYNDKELTTVYTTQLTKSVQEPHSDDDYIWYFTGGFEFVDMNYVRIPTMKTYTEIESSYGAAIYYFIVTKSRVKDDTTLIRDIQVSGEVDRLEYEENPYCINIGTQRDRLYKFGIPSGRAATVNVDRTVDDGEIPTVINSGSELDAVLHFTLPKGPKGDAGGVIVLNYISDTEPSTGNVNELWYNTINNTIKIYDTHDTWSDYLNADKGMIYMKDNVCYYFTGSGLEKTYAEIQTGESTAFDSGRLEAHGVIAKSGGIHFDWIGTEADWSIGRNNGTIPDNYICFITDD